MNERLKAARERRDQIWSKLATERNRVEHLILKKRLSRIEEIIEQLENGAGDDE